MKLSYGRDPRTAVVRGRQRGRRKDGCQPTPGEEGGANLNLSLPRSTTQVEINAMWSGLLIWTARNALVPPYGPWGN